MLSILAMALAFANGANDNFKGVATLYGCGALSYRKALAWATLTTMAGSLAALSLASALVRSFSGRGLVSDALAAADPAFLLSVALAAAATVLLATRFGFPISTTHALTGGLLGSALALGGVRNMSLSTLGASFVLPLLLSPVLSAALSALLYSLARKAAERLGITEEMCVCVGGVEQRAAYLPGRGAVRLATGLTVSVDNLERCERRYSGQVLGFDMHSSLNRLHTLSGGAVGFARGLNDTPKIAGLMLAATGLGIGGSTVCVALAMALGGLAAHRVARTMAFGITPIDHGQGVSANLVTAFLVTLASPLGLPVSTTHVSCGSLFGIGAVTGEARWRTIRQILAAWVTTLPLAAGLAALTAFSLRGW